MMIVSNAVWAWLISFHIFAVVGPGLGAAAWAWQMSHKHTTGRVEKFPDRFRPDRRTDQNHPEQTAA